MKLNLYFDLVRRSQELIDLDIAVRSQRESLDDIKARQLKLDDNKIPHRVYRLYQLEYNEESRILQSFTLDEKKVARARREACFFANTTQVLDINAMTAQHHYSLRDEQEKFFAMMKGILQADRQRNLSELGREGRLFVLFVAQSLGYYFAHVRKDNMYDQFHSIQDILNEIRPIRYIEHPGAKPFITPFIGKQVTICEAFGFDIPSGDILITYQMGHWGYPSGPQFNVAYVVPDIITLQ